MKTIDRYTYRVAWSDEDREFFGSCAEFPSLSWLDKSPGKALAGIRKVVADCVKDIEESKEPLPEPIASRNFSGKFMVRVPPQLHRELTIRAAESGISLNRLVTHKLSQDS